MFAVEDKWTPVSSEQCTGLCSSGEAPIAGSHCVFKVRQECRCCAVCEFLVQCVLLFFAFNTSFRPQPEEFKTLAYNKGHYLSDEELAAAMSSLSSSGGNGSLTLEDFERWWAKGGNRWSDLSLSDEQQGTIAALVQCFKWFDANEDGTLSWDEWPDCFAQLLEYEYVLPAERGGPTEDELFKAIDVDGSDAIACNEFLAYCISKGALGAGVGSE